MRKNIKSQLTKEQNSEIFEVYDAWLKSYLNGGTDTYGHYLDKDYHFIGSTAYEEFLNKADTSSFFERTADQLSGKTDLRNNSYVLEKFGNIVFLTHLFDAWFLNGSDWSYYSRFRFTNALHETKDGWRFIYQHFSTPDEKAEEGQTIGYQKISEENLQLREAIKRRTTELEEKNRELEIESALERVRSEALAMDKSSDLLDIVVTMRKEFTALGHEAHYFWHMLWLPDKYEKAMTSGDGTKIGMVMELPRHIHGKIPLLKNWEKGNEPTVVYAMDAEEAIDYVHKMVELGDFQQVDPQAPSDDDIRRINGLTFIMARTTNGEIGYSLPGVVKDPSQDSLQLLRRFAKAFDFAHKRFQDLKRKEKQSREIEIELALEKIRSRSMAMHTSDELADLSQELVKQVQALGVSTWFCAFNIYDDDEKGSIEWGSNGEGTFPRYRTPREGIFLKYYKAGQRGETLLINEIGEEECPAHYEYLCTLPGVGDQLLKMKKDGIPFPSYQIDHVAYFKYGYIIYITYEPVPESHEIFKRFAKVFEQTYTRFLDLKKAEAQAREAQIEAALERVRSKSMAMHHSDELLFVATIIFHELDRLGINTNMGATAISINIPDSEDMESYVCGDGGDDLVVKKYIHPYSDNKFTKDLLNSRNNPGQIFVRKYSRKDKDKFYHHLFNNSELRDMSEETKSHILETNSLILTAIASDDFVLSLVDLEDNTLTESQTDILSRFSNVFKQSYTRFLDLQKAEKQARENQIEAALERVRSKTMAMHKSEDMEVTVLSLFDEVVKLGMGKNIRCGIGIIDKESNYMETFSATKSSDGKVELVIGQLNTSIHPLLNETREAWANGDSTFEYHLDKEELLVYYTGLNNEPDYPFQRDLSNLPNEEFHKGFFFDKGDLFVFSQEPIDDETSSIFRRFAKVFQQSYTRFRDLLKAEKQARENQIEAALERVRSKTMAMHKSEDMELTVLSLFDEVVKLELGENIRCGIGIMNKETNYMETFSATRSSKGKVELVTGHLNMNSHPLLIGAMESWANGDSTYESHMDKEELLGYYSGLNKEPDYPFQRDLSNLPDEEYHKGFFFDKGELFVFSQNPISDEESSIFRRFAKVFQQSYTRFQDLLKAEKQAREAQIEAALERVRSKAMAMRNSVDIGESITVLFEEINNLGFQILRIGIGIMNNDKTLNAWTTSTSEGKKIIEIAGKLEMDIHPALEMVYAAWKESESHASYKLEGADAEQYYKAISQQRNYSVPNSEELKKIHFLNAFFFKYGVLYIFTRTELDSSEIGVLERFTKVFALTYQRYQELIESEKREKEAVKQSSLDRVRGEIASMRTSEDLNQITPIIWRELQALEVPFFRCGVFIVNEEKQKVQVYLTTPKGKSLGVLSLGMEANEITMNIMKAWRKKNIYKTHWDKNEFINWTKSLMEIGQVKNAETYQGSSAAPDSLNLHFVPFKQGMLYVGAVQQLEDDKIDLVKALAEAFSIAYARYEDFKKLEEAKNRIESTLDELKSAQRQLIQSEKMASLGELTAGIAHEIKNPLNFVNNFSEVSKELLVELEEELDGGDSEIVKELLGDVIQNLDKILHHGRRADSIVKGMLQHSRSNSGEKELTDINLLTEEYLNLAYHGLRAMDKSFNSSLVKKMDPKIPKVRIVPQEIGRVILNLVNNAFYAVNEKKKKTANEYNPEVKVETNFEKGKIKIAVGDNGNGIPQHVLDKIFQPFFTTKPTGQGTGLGLSLSYDIIKAHGGELKADTEEGKGTIFSILLPV